MRKLMQPLSCLIFVGSICACFNPALSADVLTLKSGGSAEGTLLNPDDDPRTQYVMRLESGGEFTFRVDQVVKHLTLSDAQRRYKSLLKKMPVTADANWKLAEWCKGKGLRAERGLHLEAAIQLNSDHELARRALGYSLLDEKWVKKKDFAEERAEKMTERGFQIHKGSWRLPQDIALDKKRREADLARKTWARDIKRWRGWLGKRKNDEALAKFRAINDPSAAAALAAALSEESERVVRHLYVGVLSRLRSTAATKALVQVVLTTPLSPPGDLDLRDKALSGLEKNGRELAVNAFIHALGNKDNRIVRRAGYALLQMPEERATRPLIEALRTKHTYKIGKDNPGQLSTSFGGSGSGGGGIGLGSGGKAKTVTDIVPNREVLDALLAITDGAHAEFQYNQDLWRRWMATRDLPPTVDLRRGG